MQLLNTFVTIVMTVLELPFGPVRWLPSPDNSHILYGVNLKEAPQLWVEDTRTHRRKLLLELSSTARAGWSSDGTAFFVENHRSSDSTRAYIYDTTTLRSLDVAARILASYPEVTRFADGHAYFSVNRWDGTQHVLIHLFGHTDHPPPAECFEFRFRVGRDGTVRKLSGRVQPVSASCLG